jgi:hypothetical protein
MTVRRDPDRLIRAYLDEGPTKLPERSYDAVRVVVDHTRQRVVFGPWMGPRMSNFARIAMAAAAVVLAAAVVGINLQPPQAQIGGPGPSPTPSPAATAVKPTTGTGFVDIETVRVSFEFPAGWESENIGALNWLRPIGDRPALLLMTVVTNVYDRPCGDPRSPAVGPSVDDLAIALAELEGLEASTPVDATLDGYRGKQLTLTAPSSLEGCQSRVSVWSNTDSSPESYLDFGEVTSIWILDVEGTRLVVRTMVLPDTTADERAETQQIFDSIRLDRTPSR